MRGDVLAFIIAVIAIVFGIALFIALIVMAVNYTSMPGYMAEIEQLRADAAVVDPQQAEDVIGQVTQWNQTIESSKTYNAQWWSGWTLPDEWDSIELIPVPQP
jgi:hypothetical protein